MDPLEDLYANIVNSLFQNAKHLHCNTIVKKHDSNLAKTGDISISLDPMFWKRCMDGSDNNLLLLLLKTDNRDNLRSRFEELVEKSKEWCLPLRICSIFKDRCSLFLDRLIATKFMMHHVLKNDDYGKQLDFPARKVYINFRRCTTEPAMNISEYRAYLVHNILQHVLPYINYELCETRNEDALLLNTESYATPSEKDITPDCVNIKCGIVIDPLDNKIAKISNEEYISLRSTDMQLMAMHKYGIRVQNEERFRTLINHLGRAAVSIDLLEVKHSSPVTIKRNNQGCSKGASFILYNSARVQTLLRKFDDYVDQGLYENLPKLEDIDLSLLKEEEEWQLLFNFVMTFPSLVKRTLEGIDDGKCSPHLLIKFLTHLVGLFSIYYRRVKILMEPRPHLMPTIYARVYLVKAVQKILNRVLGFLDIQSVARM